MTQSSHSAEQLACRLITVNAGRIPWRLIAAENTTMAHTATPDPAEIASRICAWTLSWRVLKSVAVVNAASWGVGW